MIVKTLLEEPVLTRSERALIQSLYKANSLAEGIRVCRSLRKDVLSNPDYGVSQTGAIQGMPELDSAEEYLKAQIVLLLKSHKLPRVASDSKSDA